MNELKFYILHTVVREKKSTDQVISKGAINVYLQKTHKPLN